MAAHAVQHSLRTDQPVRTIKLTRPARRRSRKAVRRARTLAVLFVLLVAALVLVLFPRSVHTQSHSSVTTGVEYIVAPGDTLWEIAARHAGRKDVREVIYLIEQANELKSSAIQPGQVLFIPTVDGNPLAGR
ncbi:MAG: LysM peptidoglycan-binding domain-containing protein [Bacillota bacterium]